LTLDLKKQEINVSKDTSSRFSSLV